MDDILIHGSNQQEHDEHLIAVLEHSEISCHPQQSHVIDQEDIINRDALILLANYWNNRKAKAEQNAGIIGENLSKIYSIAMLKMK